MIVHIGVVLIAVGVASSEAYKTDRSATLLPGQSVVVADHEFTYLELKADENDRRQRIYAEVQIDGEDIYAPAQTRYLRSGMVVPTPSVRPGFSEDLFLVLDKTPDDPLGPVRLRIIVRPMISWLWTGGALMGIGSILAIFPGKRRRGTEAVSAVLVKAQKSSEASGGSDADVPSVIGVSHG
jgi:cytochrome c-type biogenesis protein CcmF